MPRYDIAFLGHMCIDEIQPYQGERTVRPGSAVLCGAAVAARVGKRTAAIVKMAEPDSRLLITLKELGVDTYIIPASETTVSEVVHNSPDVDERRITLRKSAGRILIDEIPEIITGRLHLAGISDDEFDMPLMEGLAAKGYNLSVDMQSFVRQVDPATREVRFDDVPAKREIARLMQKVKLDVVEARVLTGADDLEAAAKVFESYGCPEVMITRADGVLVRAYGRTFWEPFSNATTVGRTGRGDTAFAAYLARRMETGAAESTRFAAALVSIKMETAGPFRATLDDVMKRMRERHAPKAQ